MFKYQQSSISSFGIATNRVNDVNPLCYAFVKCLLVKCACVLWQTRRRFHLFRLSSDDEVQASGAPRLYTGARYFPARAVSVLAAMFNIAP